MMLKRVPCDICKQEFNPAYLNIHKRIHTGEKPYECALCGSRFMFHSGIHYHKRTAHKNIPKDQQGGLEYDYLVHGKKIGVFGAKCTTCHKLFPNKAALRDHEPIHKPQQEPYSCSLCSKQFTDKDTYINHVCISSKPDEENLELKETEQTEMQVKCLHCSQTFPGDNELANHMKVHNTGNSLLRCKKCYRFYRTKEQLRLHKENEHSKSIFKCIKCGKQFTKKSKLDFHTCSNSREATPDTVESSAKEKDLANETKRKRTSFSRKQCPVCYACFDRQYHLDLHYKIHENVRLKPYRCTVCGAGFFQMGARKMHMIKIHKFGYEQYLNQFCKNGVYECVICKLVLKSHFKLVEHMKTHSKDSSTNYNKTEVNTLKETKEHGSGEVMGRIPKIKIKVKKSDKDSTVCKIDKHDEKSKKGLVPASEISELVSVNRKILEKYDIDSNRIKLTETGSGKGLYVCEVCDSSFTLKTNFKRHVRNKAYDHKLYLKPKSTVTLNVIKKKEVPSERRKHFRHLHSKQKKHGRVKFLYQTNEVKDTKRDKSDMKLMKRYKYVCDVCGLSYTRKLNMKQHRSKHTDEAFKMAGVQREEPEQSERDKSQLYEKVSSTSDPRMEDYSKDLQEFDVYVDMDEIPEYEELVRIVSDEKPWVPYDTKQNGSEYFLDNEISDPALNNIGKNDKNMLDPEENLNYKTNDLFRNSDGQSGESGTDTDFLPAGSSRDTNFQSVKTKKDPDVQRTEAPRDSNIHRVHSLNNFEFHPDGHNKVCPGCEQPITAGQKVIDCHLCCTQFCLVCSAVPVQVYDLAFANRNEPSVVWFCRVCKPLYPKFTVLLRQLSEFEESIHDKISDLEKNLKLIKKNEQFLAEKTSSDR